jgi:Questin oxidase-like
MSEADAKRDGSELTRREFHQRAAIVGSSVLWLPSIDREDALSSSAKARENALSSPARARGDALSSPARAREDARASAAIESEAASSSPSIDRNNADAQRNSASTSAAEPEMSRSDDTLDAALELLKDTGPEYDGGLSNHGPMVAEALCALGREDAVIPWVKRYRQRLIDPPTATKKIPADEWRAALGDLARDGDWSAFMQRELADHPWQEVLDTWVARLTPGFAAAAAHGLIRTAHATRSLALRDTPLRRRELAQGLAYWAASYQELSVSNRKSMMHSNVHDAIARIELLPADKRPRGGSIVHGLTALNDLSSFASVIHFVAPGGDTSAFISELTEAFAHVYLANAQDSGRRITFIHAVTGPSAVRLIAPHVKPETAQAASRYAWQVAAGIYAAFGDSRAVEASEDDAIDPRTLPDLCVKSGDEHAIKMTEACLREHALNPKPVYLAAALDACRHLSY